MRMPEIKAVSRPYAPSVKSAKKTIIMIGKFGFIPNRLKESAKTTCIKNASSISE